MNADGKMSEDRVESLSRVCRENWLSGLVGMGLTLNKTSGNNWSATFCSLVTTTTLRLGSSTLPSNHTLTTMKFSAKLFFGVAQTVPALCANVISIPLTRKSNQDHDSLAKRSISQRVQNWGNMYTAEVQVGTPPQTMILDIDTGSTDTWVLGHSNQNDCVAEPYNCRGNDTFHAEKSNTYHEVTQDGWVISIQSCVMMDCLTLMKLLNHVCGQ